MKKGDKHKVANYRPVSLTSITCKLLEHIIHSNVMAHFDKHHILKDHQHGFRKRRSCETQLTVTIQEVASRLSKGNQVDIILLDFAKAPDKVPLSKFLHKLDFYGVRDQTSNWIRSFLENRKQEVVLDVFALRPVRCPIWSSPGNRGPSYSWPTSTTFWSPNDHQTVYYSQMTAYSIAS